MLFDISEDVDLVDSTFLEFFIFLEASNLNDFDCIFSGIEFVRCSVDFSVGSFADNFVEGVVFDDSNHFNN